VARPMGDDRDANPALETERIFRLLIESVRDYAIYVMDPAGLISSWNAGAERLKGYTEDEVIGRHYRMFYPAPEQESDLPDRHLEIAARVGRVEGEGWRIRKDGTRFWARVVITALYEDGELIGYGKVTGDMTAYRQAQEAMRQRERQLEEAQQIAHLGSWEWDLQDDLLRWSDELFRIFGLEPGRPFHHEEYLELLDPEDRGEVARKVREAVESGETYVHEHRIRRPDGEERWIQSRGEVTTDEDGHPLRMVGTSLDITELKEAEARARRLAAERVAREAAERTAQRMGFLAEASALLGASLEYSETLRTVAWLAVPSFADWCAVDMVRPDGGLERLAVAHMDPDRLALAWELDREYPPDTDDRHGLASVVRTGEAELKEDVSPAELEAAARDDRHMEILRGLGLRSSIIVPIQVRDRTLGAISFVRTESERRYSQEDLVVAQELAARAGLAIENAQLHAAEREARRSAERASDRTARLQAITAGLSEAVTPGGVAAVIVDQGVAALEADTGTLVLARPDRTLEIVRSVGIPDDIVDRFRAFEMDAGIPIAEAVRSGEPVILEDLEARQAREPWGSLPTRVSRPWPRYPSGPARA
jgi:PAS domain S-box-containing protein